MSNENVSQERLPFENIQSWNRHEANEAAPKATILVNFSCFIIHDAVMWPVSEEQTRAVQTWGDVLPIFIFAGRPRKSTDENSWLAITTLVCMVCSSLVVFARTWQGLLQMVGARSCVELGKDRKKLPRGLQKLSGLAQLAQVPKHLPYILCLRFSEFRRHFTTRHYQILALAWFGHVMYKKGWWCGALKMLPVSSRSLQTFASWSECSCPQI